MATLIERAATSTTLTGLVMVPVGSEQCDFQINPVLAEDCGQTHRKITGHTLDQLAVVNVYEKFEVHAAFIVAKVRVCGGVVGGVGCPSKGH